jgi:ankyrin repeat protein
MASGEELLCNAVKGGDVVTLDGLLNQYRGIDVNFKTGEGLNLLMVAIREAGQNQRGQFNEVVQLLVQIGCDVNAIDDQYGRTAAHWAVYYHKEDILMELLIAGADVSLPDYSGISPFLLAIQETSVKCVSTMMRYSPKEMLNYPDHEGRSPLLYAIYGGSVQMCSLLVELGASINLPDQVTGRTPFHWACLNGQKDIIDFFCQKESDVQAQDGEGRLPVHLAATCEQKEGLQVLFKAYGSNVLELVDVGGLTPLMYACASSLEESIKYLLKKKVNVLAEDNDGKSCLHWAVEASTPEAVLCVQLLCKTHPELTKQRDQVGRTPLLWACVQSSVSNLSILIDLRDDVTVVDNDEHTAAHWATVSGSPKCLSLLAQSGAPVTLRDKNGATPLHYAAQNSRDTTDNSLSDTLYTGSPQGILECLQILLDCGADVEATDNEGNTPFHWGIQSPNNFTALSYLVGAGVDPNRKNNDGQTGLHLAAKQGITENCQFLIEAVGDVAVEGDNEGQTPLFNAVEGGHVECARYLISIGANVNHLNHEKRSPIHVASSVGSVECVQLLSSSGADLQQRTVHGALPIHEAAANGHTAVLEFLLYNGCEVNSKVVGGTALHYAASGGHLEAAQLLIDCGVHINALVETTDENYYVSALDYAEASGNSELVDLIKSHGGRSGEDVAKKSVFVIQKHLRRHKLKMKKQGRKVGCVWSHH